MINNDRSKIPPLRFFARGVSALVFAALFAIATSAQSNEIPQGMRIPTVDDRKDQKSSSVEELVVKQEISRRKKEYDEMLKRADEALKLSEDLETAFETKHAIAPGDLQKLQTIEKTVSRIREDLGGDDEDDDLPIDSASAEPEATKDVLSAVKYLRKSTAKLVDELKRSTRFSVSVAAIQTSNTVIRFARFLRLKK